MSHFWTTTVRRMVLTLALALTLTGPFANHPAHEPTPPPANHTPPSGPQPNVNWNS